MSRYKTLPEYAMPEDFNHAHFKPWIGLNYEKGGNFEQKILVLGESYYTKVHINARREETRNHLRHVIQKFAINENSGFYAKVRNLVLRGAGQSLDGFGRVEKRQNFWDSIAFYNYIQEFVGTKPKDRPKEQMWTESEAGLLEVFHKLKPDVCIVLGKELWSRILKSTDSSGTSVNLFRDESTGIRFRRVSVGGQEILCAHTPHPSSVGKFKKKQVVPVAKRLFELGGSSIKSESVG